MTLKQKIDNFVNEKKIAVLGVSSKNGKFGSMAARELMKKGYDIYPVNPSLDNFNGEKCYHSLAEIKDPVKAALVTMQPEHTEQAVSGFKQAGISKVWLQQGSASAKALELLEAAGIESVSGQCIFMFAEPVGGIHAFHRLLKKLFRSYPR